MEKLNKNKVIIVAIAALAVIAIIAIIVILVNKTGNEGDGSSKVGTISNSASEFEALKVKNVELKYDEASNQTIIDFAIQNTTEEKVENLTVQIQLLNESENVMAGVETYVSTIDAKGEHKVNMMLGGNIKGIKKIKLVNPVKETPAQ